MRLTVFDYIKRRIDVLLELFPNAKVKYGHDSFARIHIIEISPDSVFEEDSFRRWDSETIEGFIQLCPEENLCVTPEDDVMPIDEFVEFVKEKESERIHKKYMRER